MSRPRPLPVIRIEELDVRAAARATEKLINSNVDASARAASLKCHFCSEPAERDDYCFGCKKHVCQRCEHPVADARPHGPHAAPAHRAHAQAVS